MQPVIDDHDVLGIVGEYAADAAIGVAQDVDSSEFAGRLVHAANREFGVMVAYIISAIRRALLDDVAAVSLSHFANAYERKTNCPRFANPFLEKDFERIDVKAWLVSEEAQI
ncbi:hypothetical protein [Roseovarius sp. M141]|uniref:hypothetical protein n=1 Tax=Roseovarius sp. M141 TaxID=2583806 RepID=UPI0020CEC73F|nr:hypothetical protein [Roseovarius sp. M141]